MPFTHTVSHYLFPGYTNNQKAKLIHSTTIFLYIFILVAYQIALQFIPATGVRILGYAANISVNDVVNLTNKKREENGLEPLTYNETLASAAHAKGEDMLAKNYWAHVAPDGTQPWKFFMDSGYNYRYAGENLARDFSNASAAVDAWMASPSHRENMLSAKYKDIGIAVVEGDLDGVDTTIIIQLFGTVYSDKLPSVPIASAETTEVTPQVKLSPTPTILLTPTPTPLPLRYVATNARENPPIVSGIENQLQTGRVLISPFTTTKNLSILTVFMLFSVMVVDAVVTHKRKIPRIGGRTFAHLAFLGMILAIALIAKAGSIL